MKSGSIFSQMSIFLSTGTELTSVEKVGFVCGTVAWKCSVIKRCSFKFCKIDRKLPVNVFVNFEKFLGTPILQAKRGRLPLYLSWPGIFY